MSQGGIDLNQIQAMRQQGVATKAQMRLNIAVSIFNAGKADSVSNALVLANEFIRKTEEQMREELETHSAKSKPTIETS